MSNNNGHYFINVPFMKAVYEPSKNPPILDFEVHVFRYRCSSVILFLDGGIETALL